MLDYSPCYNFNISTSLLRFVVLISLQNIPVVLYVYSAPLLASLRWKVLVLKSPSLTFLLYLQVAFDGPLGPALLLHVQLQQVHVQATVVEMKQRIPAESCALHETERVAVVVSLTQHKRTVLLEGREGREETTKLSVSVLQVEVVVLQSAS